MMPLRVFYLNFMTFTFTKAFYFSDISTFTINADFRICYVSAFTEYGCISQKSCISKYCIFKI